MLSKWLLSFILLGIFVTPYAEIMVPENTLGKSCLSFYKERYGLAKKTKVFVYGRDEKTGVDRCTMHRGDGPSAQLIKEAKAACKKAFKIGDCKLIAINENWMVKEGDFSPITQPEPVMTDSEIEQIMQKAKVMLRGNCTSFFKSYLKKENFKAFAYAVDDEGRVSCSGSSNQQNTKVIRTDVINSCEKYKNKLGNKAPATPCKIFLINNQLLAKPSDYAHALQSLKDKPIDLFELAKTGVPSELQNALDAGIDINIQDKFGSTPLLRAIGKNRLDNVKFLVESGADIHHKENLGYDALNTATYTRYNNLQLIKYLIEKGADINTKTKRPGDSPLHNAAYMGRTELVKLLLEKGVDVNVKNNYIETAMHKAADQNQVDILKILLINGAEINAKTRRNITPLDEALFRHHKDATKFLESKGAKKNNPHHE